jgi:methylphosphotriester-DNA--protein-cysteine methyltransferase
LVVVEAGDLARLATDPESDPLADVAFPEPRLADPALARDFALLHAPLEAPTTRLERDQRLTQWLRAVAEDSATARPARPARPARTTRSPRDDRALRVACEYLGDNFTPQRRPRRVRHGRRDREVSARTAVSYRIGLPPHALLTAHRIRRARRLIEPGEPIAAVATATGFADQSHLDRHFQRGLGMTPASTAAASGPELLLEGAPRGCASSSDRPAGTRAPGRSARQSRVSGVR